MKGDPMPHLRRSCGTMDAHNGMLETDPVYRANRLTIEGYTAARAFAKAALPKVVTIPVVVHVVYASAAENISDAQVKSQIDVLNHDYRKKNADISKIPAPFKSLAADARIQFALATRA